MRSLSTSLVRTVAHLGHGEPLGLVVVVIEETEQGEVAWGMGGRSVQQPSGRRVRCVASKEPSRSWLEGG